MRSALSRRASSSAWTAATYTVARVPSAGVKSPADLARASHSVVPCWVVSSVRSACRAKAEPPADSSPCGSRPPRNLAPTLAAGPTGPLLSFLFPFPLRTRFDGLQIDFELITVAVAEFFWRSCDYRLPVETYIRLGLFAFSPESPIILSPHYDMLRVGMLQLAFKFCYASLRVRAGTFPWCRRPLYVSSG